MKVKSVLAGAVGALCIVITLGAGGAGSANSPSETDGEGQIAPVMEAVLTETAKTAPHQAQEPADSLSDPGDKTAPTDIVGVEVEVIRETEAASASSPASITADQKVYVLVLHPENNRFIRCEKDVPLGEIKDLGNGRWSFPNGHGDAVTTDWLIMSQPYNEGDEEIYVEVWKTTAEGDFVTDAVISERQIFLDPRDSKSIFVCWNGSYLDGEGVDKNELLDHIEEYYINPVPVKTETRVVRVTPLN